ncbi:hypothetical protein GCM10027575_49580 [Phytohabitans suffuscus]
MSSRQPTRGLPRLARLFAYAAAFLALGTVLAAGSAMAGAGVSVAAADPTPAPGMPDADVRPSPDPTTPASTPSPIEPPPTTTPTPAPSTPTPDPSQGPTPPGWNPPTEDGTDDPGLFDIPGQIRKAINDFFAWVVEGALNPVLSALGEAVLTTPDLTGDERVRTMWTTSLVVANAVFVLFIVVAGIIVTSRETLQTSYGLKEIAPRLAVAGVLMNTSLLLTGKAIELANAITAEIAGQGVDGHAAAAALTQALGEARNGNSFLLTLMVLGVLVMAIVVVFTFVLRIAFLAILLGIAPLALLCHALPQTEPLAFTWWRGLTACLGIQVGQAVVLLGALRMFLTPAGENFTAPGVMIGIPTPSRLVSILVVAAMVWLLLKIPGWMRHLVLGPLARSGGRGLIGQIVHTVLLVKTLGTAAGLARTGGRAAHGAARASARRRRTPAPTGTPGPRRTRSPRRRTPPAPAPRRGPRPGPAPFSHAPAVHTPLPAPAGTNGPPGFSHPATPATGRTAPAGGVPPAPFSHTPTSAPPRPAAGSQPAPVRFSGAPAPASGPRPTRQPTAPAAAPTFSAAPRPQTAPKRPPAPVAPAFSSAPQPTPTRRLPTPPARTTPPTRTTPAARTTPPARSTPPQAQQERPTSRPPATPPRRPARRRPPGSDS